MKPRSSRETSVVARGSLFDGRLVDGGTDGSNPSPSSGESYELAGRDRYRFTARQQRGQRQRSARRAEGQRARGIPKA